MDKKATAIMEQIYSLPSLMKEIGRSTRNDSAKVAEEINPTRLKRIILTGCGDSYAAAIAARQVFMEYTGLIVEVETVIDLSRYHTQKQLVGENGDTLIIIISNSGNISRVIELAKRIKKLGGQTLAVTGNANSELYKEALYTLKLNIPKFHRSGPGMRSYCACLLGLYELAFAFGKNQDLLLHLDCLPDKIQQALPTWDEQAQRLAELFKHSKSYEFIGAGSDFAAAWFASAKEIEVAALPAASINTEDWLHMNYFVRDVKNTATVVFANSQSPGASRSRELIKVAVEMERLVAVITDDKETWGSAENLHVIETPSCHRLLQPFIQYIPVSMAMSYIGESIGEEDFRGTTDHWTACIDFATVAASKQEIWE